MRLQPRVVCIAASERSTIDAPDFFARVGDSLHRSSVDEGSNPFLTATLPTREIPFETNGCPEGEGGRMMSKEAESPRVTNRSGELGQTDVQWANR